MHQNSVLGGRVKRWPVCSRRAFGAVAAVYCACEGATGAKRRREPIAAKRRREPSREAPPRTDRREAAPRTESRSGGRERPVKPGTPHARWCIHTQLTV